MSPFSFIILFMDFDFFVWNCLGPAKKGFGRILQAFIKQFTTLVLVILKPRITGDKADKIIIKSGYDFSHRVKSNGFSGGIWILWRNVIEVRILANHRQFIHMQISGDGGMN